MTIAQNKEARNIDPRIRKELLAAAKRLRENRLYQASSKRWLMAAGIIVLILGTRTFWPATNSLVFPAVCGVVLVTWFLNLLGQLKTPLDFSETAKAVEEKFPELGNMLTTASEQKRPVEGYNFLQEKVITSALQFSFFQYWEDTGKRKQRHLRLKHFGALILVLGLGSLSWFSKGESHWIDAPDMPVLVSSVEVTPGDVEVERSSALVIAARFKGEFPRTATLVLQQDDGTTLRYPMAQSLSDPIFAYTLASVEEAAHYYIEYPGSETQTYRLDVYDLPALVQADAYLDYPDYTGIRDRLIEDTRRVSAVEGTRLNYQFLVNKPLAKVELVDRDGARIALSPTNPENTKFGTELVLTESLRYHLHLTDDQGRGNSYPPDVRIEVRDNEKPTLELTFPKGDQAVSPIEELTLEAKANDDFGLIDYGMAVAIGSSAPEYVSLKSGDPEALQANFNRLYALEEEAVEVDQLVSWFAWAEDYGVDGESRRSLSDIYYAEVRSLEEIYREGEAGGGGGGGGGGSQQEQELLEQQREIAIATFKLMQRGEDDDRFEEDSQIILDSQQQARMQLEQTKMELEEERLLDAANQAGEFMEQAIEYFTEVVNKVSEDPLEEAWLASQGAYQSLLSMRPREMRVTQGRQQGGGGGGGQNRNQRQLNQLDFNDEENRYETESQAQALTSPEERQQLEVLSKLSELARRQQQVNERLRELQTALAAAEDEEERDKIRRELKRLEEEQRNMVTQMDEVQQRMDTLPQDREMRQAGEQLQEAREDMRNISESLQEEEVSQALAAGSRAQENLEELKDEFKESTSSQFSESMRQVRDAARELAENQRNISEELDRLQNEIAPTLDGSGNRQEVTEQYNRQKEDLEALMRDLREITEDSETGEPTLHRKLYDLLRRQNQNETGENLGVAKELVERGFLDQAQQMQPGLQQSLNELADAVEEAASSVMGDETTALRFAQEELDDLLNDLEQERPEGSLADAGNLQEGGNPSADQPGERGSNPSQQEGEQAGQAPGQQQDGQNPSQQGQQPGQGQGEEQEGQLAQSQGQQPGQQSGGQQPGQQPGQQGGSQPGSQPSESLAQGGSQQGGGGSQNGQPQPGQQPGRTQATGGGGQLQDINDLIRSWNNQGGSWDGPITGDNFVDWNERVRTVEELLDLPEARQQMQEAREQAERMRAEFKRHGNPPQWEDIDDSILKPIREVESWVQQELLRKDKPDTLQPIDRDPVPPKFANSVKKYYEALGGDS